MIVGIMEWDAAGPSFEFERDGNAGEGRYAGCGGASLGCLLLVFLVGVVAMFLVVLMLVSAG